MKSKFTRDPVLILLTKVISHYEMCKNSRVSFDKYSEYDIVKEILNTLEELNSHKKPNLKLMKE